MKHVLLYLFTLFTAGALQPAVAQNLPQAAVQRAQTITTGNNAYDAGTDLDVVGLTSLWIHNTGSVVVDVAYTAAAVTAVEPALTLAAGEQRLVTFERNYGPDTLYAKGLGAAGTIKVVAGNMRVTGLQGQIVDADALADSSRIRKRSFTVGHADFGDADTSETETDPAGAFPAGAVLMGFRLVVTTGIGGASLSAVAADCGFNGATDVLTDGTNVFTGATSPTYGLGANALPNSARAIGGLTAQCTFVSTDDDIGDATLGSVTIEIYYTVPAPG
jgi:hypothetical protein